MKWSARLVVDRIPTATSQQKGYNRATGHFYKKDRVKAAEQLYTVKLRQAGLPPVAFVGPVRLSVLFNFGTTTKRNWGHYKSTRPDTDNLIKLLKDVMTEVGFWRDDSQVAHEVVIKKHGQEAYIDIEVENLEE